MKAELVIILFFLAFDAINAGVQAYLIDVRGVWINHKWSAAVAIAAAVIGQCFTAHLILPLLLAIHWPWFNLVLNAVRGKPLTYTGTITAKSSFLDRVFHYYPAMATAQLITLLIAIAIYLKVSI